TIVANDVVNRGGLTFIHDLQARSGRSAADIARAYRIVPQAPALPPLWAEIEALDNQIAASVQYEMLIDIAGVVEHAAAWLLRENRLDLAAAPARDGLAAALADLLPASERAEYDARLARLLEAKVPPPLAAQVAAIVLLTTAFEIADLAARAGQSVERAARCFYGIGARFALDEMR